MLPHERLEVFWLAQEYADFIEYLMPRIARASRNDADQLDREAGGILYNLVEAASEMSPGDKVRFLRYSRREVTESFGVLFRNHRRHVITDAEIRIAHYYTDRLSATLWRMVKKWGG
jgi:four helix bundle protein